MPLRSNSEDRSTCVPRPVLPKAALTASLKVVVSVVLPEVPVTVTVVNPVAAEDAAFNTSFRLLVVPWIDPVTPLGNADNFRVTAPLNPPMSVMVIVLFADAFWFTKTFVGPESVKPVLATALLIALAYCAANPLPTKSSYSHMKPPVIPHWLCHPVMMLCTWLGVSS